MHCQTIFTRSDNLKRHIKSFHEEEQENKIIKNGDTPVQKGLGFISVESDQVYSDEDDKSDSEEEDMEKEDAVVDKEESEDEEDEMNDEEVFDAERNEESPWTYYINKAKKAYKSDVGEQAREYMEEDGLDKKQAYKLAKKDHIDDYRKSFRQLLIKDLLHFQKLKQHPIYKKILNTKRQLIDSEDFGADEAIESAVKRRKYLLNKLIPDEDTASSDSDEYSEEE
jgi:hypothetical protein